MQVALLAAGSLVADCGVDRVADRVRWADEKDEVERRAQGTAPLLQ